MTLKEIIKFSLLIFPFFIYAQKSKIAFLDESSKKPIIGLQIFSENGSFIGNTNSTGEFELDIKLLQQGDIKSIIAYNSEYSSQEYKLNEVPNFIYLKKNIAIELETVVIKAGSSKKYFTLKGYFRSWKLVNNKLVKYGDGLVEYLLPYDSIKNDFNTGIKNHYTAYRTFKTDSIKNKSRVISITSYDNFLDTHITKNDELKRGRKHYKVIKDNKTSGDIYDEGKKVGYVSYDNNNNPSEIRVSQNFEGDEAIKVLFWKLSGKSITIEKWSGEGDFRHPTYLFLNEKKIIKTRTEGNYNNVETITEIFIDDDIIYDDKKPVKYKPNIDKGRSFYSTNYWEEQLLKHPLPSAINQQLINVNENKNSY